MFLNVVQKAQTLFKDYPSKTDKAHALANPIFSWHVKYLTYHRKKIMIFTHDASTLTVVLFDVNAKNRSEMKARFEKRLAELYQNFGMSQADLDSYLQVAGDWQIGPTVNRSQLARLNEIGVVLQVYLDQYQTDDLFLSIRLSNFVRNLAPNVSTTGPEIPNIMQAKNFQWHEPKVVTSKKIDVAHLGKVCEELKKIAVMADDYSFTDDYTKLDRQIAKIGKLNDELIASFIAHIQDDYSEKTIKSYKKTLTFYMNEYLAYHFESIFDDEASDVGDLYLHGSSMTETKRVQKCLNKFYQFLAQAKLIDDEFVKEMKESMKNSIEIVEGAWD